MLRPTTSSHSVISFLFSDTATTEIYTLSLHDALPIFWRRRLLRARLRAARERRHLLVRERANVALHVDLGAPQDEGAREADLLARVEVVEGHLVIVPRRLVGQEVRLGDVRHAIALHVHGQGAVPRHLGPQFVVGELALAARLRRRHPGHHERASHPHSHATSHATSSSGGGLRLPGSSIHAPSPSAMLRLLTPQP